MIPILTNKQVLLIEKDKFNHMTLGKMQKKVSKFKLKFLN